jgi:two-component sensor histidine kinase
MEEPSLAREKRLRLVVDEQNHRMKNLLAIVQAIAAQTSARCADVSSFRTVFSQRLSALSRSMEVLAQKGGRGASIAELVRRQLEPFGDIDGIRIAVSGPALRLNQDAAQAVGLALHELATNATKHGALSMPEGSATIRWELGRGEQGNACFRLIWRERNGPRVSAPTHQGFGSVVLQRMTGAALQGAVKHEFGSDGVSWTLEAAAETALAPGQSTALENC